MKIQFEEDVVAVRQKARMIADLLGFETLEETHIATSVSEIARNAFNYGGGGRVEFVLEGSTAPQVLLIKIEDQGPGIPDLPSILGGRYRSQTGMGQGILGARRLMDQFRIESSVGGGTSVNLRKILPRGARLRDQNEVARIQAELTGRERRTPIEEVREQNQELLRTLEELKRRQ